MHHLWGFFLKNRQFSYIVLVALLIFGVISMLSIPRESSPEVRVPVAVITTIYPGASAVDVEELLTNEIESKLEGSLEKVKEISSSSQEGVSVITVEFDANADIDSSIQDVKDEVDKAKPNLPSDAEDPFVTDVNFVDQPIMTVSIVSDLPVTELITLAEQVESELLAVSGVSKVQVSGVPEREAQIIVNQDALIGFGLGITDVVRAIQAANSSLPAGSIEQAGTQYNVAFKGAIENTSELENIAISTKAGQPVYIRDIALVADGTSDVSTYARVSIDGKPSEQAVSLSVYKRSGGDVTRISDSVRERLGELEATLLQDAEYLVTFDNGEIIKDDLKNLSSSALQTVLLVMLVLFLTLGWREALIAGISIPASMILAFIGLYMSGNTINFISLFSLILSVGVLVDSAIVMTEAIHTKMTVLKDKEEAAVSSIKEFHYPLTTGTLTTIAVFAPLFLVSGVSGQFISGIPFTIIFVLAASLIVSLAFVPLFASIFLKPKGAGAFEEKQEAYTNRLMRWYEGVLDGMLSSNGAQKRFLWGMVIAFVLALSMPFVGAVKVIFFDQEDIDFLFVEIEKPEGTVLAQTDLIARQVEEIMLEYPIIDSYVIEVGRGSQFGSNAGVNEKLASITLILDEDRRQTSSEILESLRAGVADISTADVSVFQPNNGPPTGAPVAVKFLGEDLDAIAQAISQAAAVLEETPGSAEVDTSNKSDTSEFQLTVDRAKASQVGLDASTVAFALRTALFGTEATTIKSNGEDIDVVVKLNVNQAFTTPDTTNQASIDSVKSIQIASPQGPISLANLVTSELARSTQVIQHEDGDRIGQVTSQVTPDSTVGEVTSAFMERMESVELPEGVRMEIGGETEDSNQAFKEMGLSLIVGILAIAAILVLQFASYRQMFYIISIVPLSLIGVFAGLALSGKALSFPSLMGFIALSGIVVNNSIILIDRMNKLRIDNPNMDMKDVVIEGAASRLRPILLTSLTTIIGMIPLTYASDLWSPLAYAIMFGLTFAVVVTLILVPILYYRWPGKVGRTTE
jgi:multidrug efflux pump subunit AcrB